jgi:hypothetical protein
LKLYGKKNRHIYIKHFKWLCPCYVLNNGIILKRSVRKKA